MGPKRIGRHALPISGVASGDRESVKNGSVKKLGKPGNSAGSGLWQLTDTVGESMKEKSVIPKS